MADSIPMNDNTLAALMEMGEATFEDAVLALERTGGDEKKALDLLLTGAINRQSAGDKALKPDTKLFKVARSVMVNDGDDDDVASAKAPSRSNYESLSMKKKSNKSSGTCKAKTCSALTPTLSNQSFLV